MKLSFRATWLCWALVWASPNVCRQMGWRWAFQLGPFSVVRKVKYQ